MRFNSAITAIAGVATVAALSMVAAPAHAQFTGLYNTGVAADGTTLLSAGQTDTHYTFLGGGPAVVTNTQGPPFSSSPSQYIWSNAEGTGLGIFTIRTTFTLGSTDGATLAGSFVADNRGYVVLNGTNVGPENGDFTKFTDFLFTSGFQSGTNTLDFVVNNADGPGSLKVGNLVGTVTSAAAPEPGSLALLGTSVLGVAGMVVRRRRKA